MPFTHEALVCLGKQTAFNLTSSEVTRKPTNGNYKVISQVFKTFQENYRNLLNM